MVGKTNKILIILVSVLIVLLVIAVIMFSMVIKKTNNNVKQEETAFKDNKEKNVIDIQQIEDKNEVLVAFLDGEPNNQDDNVIVIGTDTEINNNIENNSSPYYIKVNVQANTVTIYKKDGNGNYNIPLKSMICSCGAATPVEGTYSLKKYNNWQWKTLYGGGYGRYATQISGDILFNSVPYKVKGDNTSLKYEEYDKLGAYTSLGSVTLTVADAKWIYENCVAGTQITFYTSENPGPLGKPTSKLITEDEQVRGWDPTDPDENNPWKTYVRPEKKPEEDKKEENNNNQNKNNNNTLNTNATQNNSQDTTQNNTNNTTENNNNETNNNTNNSTEDNTVNNNTTSNNTTNSAENTNTTENVTQNNQTNNNVVVENRVLEQNNDVTIKSEVLDVNSLQ